MDFSNLDVQELGERVKAIHGDEVYGATLARGLAVATRNSVLPSAHAEESYPNGSARGASGHEALTTDAVMAALRTEFLKLLRPN